MTTIADIFSTLIVTDNLRRNALINCDIIYELWNAR